MLFPVIRVCSLTLRAKYIKDPPEGMGAEDIKNMSDDDLLDMDYFLNEDDDDVFG